MKVRWGIYKCLFPILSRLHFFDLLSSVLLSPRILSSLLFRVSSFLFITDILVEGHCVCVCVCVCYHCHVIVIPLLLLPCQHLRARVSTPVMHKTSMCCALSIFGRCIHVFVHPSVYWCIWCLVTRLFACVYFRVNCRIFFRMWVCLWVCMYLCMYVSVCIYVYVVLELIVVLNTHSFSGVFLTLVLFLPRPSLSLAFLFFAFQSHFSFLFPYLAFLLSCCHLNRAHRGSLKDSSRI